MVYLIVRQTQITLVVNWFNLYRINYPHYILCIYVNVGMDQYLLIPFLGEWTSIYELFWGSPGVQGFDTLPCPNNQMVGLIH